MDRWPHGRILPWFELVCLASFVIAYIGSTGASHADYEPTERAKLEIQRAIDVAYSLEIGPLDEPRCVFPESCSLYFPKVGTLGLALSRDGAIHISSVPDASGEPDVTMCRWVVALSTGIKDLNTVNAITRALILEVKSTGKPASNKEFGATIEAKPRFGRFIRCESVRPLISRD